MILIVGFQCDKEIRKIVLMPEIPDEADDFLYLADRIVVCERPCTPNGQDRRAAANLEMMIR